MSENLLPEPRPTQSTEIGKLALALSKAQAKINGAAKGSDNPFFKSKYADLYQCIEAAKGPLSENELAVIQTTRDSEKGITIITTLAHSSGQWIRGELTMNPKKDDDQGRGSSITYGRRYAYAAITGLAQKDDDGNGACATDKKAGQTPAENEDTTIDNLEKEADKNAGSVESLGKWYKAKGATIGKLSAPSQKKINSYVTQLKAVLTEEANAGKA